MAAQLRRYRIRDGEMDAFIEEWQRLIVPLRMSFGFRVDGAWCNRGTNEFVWVLSYDGPEGFEAREAAYFASPGRHAVSPDPARHHTHAETLLLTPVAV